MYYVLKPAVQFVGGLDNVRFRKLFHACKLGFAGFAFCWWCGVAGMGTAIFSDTKGAQDAGTIVNFVGIGTGLTSIGAALMYTEKQLKAVLQDLDEGSNAHNQVKSLKKGVWMMSQLCVNNIPPFFIAPFINVFVAVGGVATMWGGTNAALVMAGTTLWYENKRRKASLRKASMVFPHAANDALAKAAAAEGAIKKSAARATGVLEEDAARRAALDVEQARPEGLDKNGVSLTLLSLFQNEFSLGTDTSATAVCEDHVKPTTESASTSLVALLQVGGDGGDGAQDKWVGEPTHFVSYAWQYPFPTLINCIASYEQENPPAQGSANHYFVDQFSLNQHIFVEMHNPTHEALSPEEKQQKLVDALTATMCKAGSMLMCLWPWDNPIPLTRSWCLFELYVAIKNDIPVSMCYSDSDINALYQAVNSGTFDAAKIVGEIRAQDAQALMPQDKELILGFIQKDIGIDTFNAKVQVRVCVCMRVCCERIADGLVM
eukprot:g4569.t1